VEPRADPVMLSTTFLPQEAPRDAPVVRLPPLEISTTRGMACLEESELRKRDPGRSARRWSHRDTVERGFVGVQGQEGGRAKRLGRVLLEDKDDSPLGDVELLDANLRALQDLPMVRPDFHKERTPLAIA
jgi:hypothetical protein